MDESILKLSQSIDMTKLPEPLDLSFAKFNGKDNEKSPIIIYHGILDKKESWTDLGQKICEQTGRTVYCFDLRNHGSSPWSDIFNFSALISDVIHFLNKNNIEKAIFLGHSLGGLTFSRLATLYPNLVEKLIIVDIHPKSSLSRTTNFFIKIFCLFMEQTIKNYRRRNLDLETARSNLNYWLKIFFLDEPNRKMALEKLIIRNGQLDWEFNLDGLIKSIETIDEKKDIVPDFKGSVLLVYGGKSRFFTKKNIPEVLLMFPDTKFECIKNGNHIFHRTHPHEFLEKVFSFLND